MDDLALLREYAANNSEAAFAELVSRRVGFVYAAALRQVRDPHLAEEITQAVFIILAQKAGKISDKTILAGWLFKTTRYAAIAQTREAAKRSLRTATIEQEMQMQTEIQSAAFDPLWEQMSPLLDEALASLGETDRQAVLLRFFENQSLAEVGRQLGTSEDTARKRVTRALEKLHRYFNKRGVSSTTAIIAGAMTANSVHAAPMALAKSVTAVAIAKGAAAGGSTLTLVKGALKIMAWTKAKMAIAVGVAVVLAAGTTTTLVIHHQSHPKPHPTAAGQTNFPKASWAFAGYATPEDALQSMFWAMRQGNMKILFASQTPQAETQTKVDMQTATVGEAEVGLANVYESQVGKQLAGELARPRYTGYRILEKREKTSDEIVFKFAIGGGKNKSDEWTIKRIGGEWKVDETPW